MTSKTHPYNCDICDHFDPFIQPGIMGCDNNKTGEYRYVSKEEYEIHKLTGCASCSKAKSEQQIREEIGGDIREWVKGLQEMDGNLTLSSVISVIEGCMDEKIFLASCETNPATGRNPCLEMTYAKTLLEGLAECFGTTLATASEECLVCNLREKCEDYEKLRANEWIPKPCDSPVPGCPEYHPPGTKNQEDVPGGSDAYQEDRIVYNQWTNGAER